MITKAKYTQLIKEKYPDLEIHTCSLIDHGQNCLVVIINDEFIFKFLRYRQVIEELKKERDLLPKLSGFLSLEIPLPCFSSFESEEPGSVFLGYRMIKGVPLVKERFDQLKNKREVAAQIGIFLKELHSLPLSCVEDRLEKRDGHAYWSQMLQQIKEKLFPYIREDAKLSIDKTFREFLNNRENFSYKPVLTHGDLGTANILYDEMQGKIRGVIDFGQMALDDPAIDVASLICPMGYGEALIDFMLEQYPQIQSLLPRATFYMSTFALQEALFGFETGDQEAFRSGLLSYR